MNPAGPIHPYPDMFAPVSAPAEAIRQLWWLVGGISFGILLVVGGVLWWCATHFRSVPGDDREPPQVYGSNQIEFAWTIVPILIVLVLFLATARTIYDVQAMVPPADTLEVTLVGHQWWWEVRYPGLGIVTANEIHVPASTADARRPTFLTLESADVIHSFWVPQLAGKTDVIPARHNRTWIEPTETGTFLGQCAEYCGTQHANMLLRVVVDSPADFATWVEAQKRPAVDEARVAAGRAVFESTACVNCHTVAGTNGRGTFGPDLTHLMSRSTIAAGAAPNTPENLRAWIVDPHAIKPGALMPAMKLPDDQVDLITAYLSTLH
ncbi:MAG: cytochrome c oxidase subunit II [Alphaproteobacteria bacterium]